MNSEKLCKLSDLILDKAISSMELGRITTIDGLVGMSDIVKNIGKYEHLKELREEHKEDHDILEKKGDLL